MGLLSGRDLDRETSSCGVRDDSYATSPELDEVMWTRETGQVAKRETCS